LVRRCDRADATTSIYRITLRRMRSIGVLLTVAWNLAACSPDTVTSRYATLAAARADRLFERGWLPDLLPPSTVRIRTSNNLDLGTSSGEFHFAPAQAPRLFRRLAASASAAAPFEAWHETVQHYEGRGFTAWTYEQDHTTWVFFCQASEGRCDYVAWLDR
jgi:hypothetical protein